MSFKTIVPVLFIAFAALGGEGPLELKLIAARTEYVLDRGGKSREEFAALLATSEWGFLAPPVVFNIELKNISDNEVSLFGGPPQFVMKGPGEDSTVEVYNKSYYYVAPAVKIVLRPGESVMMGSINWFLYDNGAQKKTALTYPFGSLSFSVGRGTKSLY